MFGEVMGLLFGQECAWVHRNKCVSECLERVIVEVVRKGIVVGKCWSLC